MTTVDDMIAETDLALGKGRTCDLCRKPLRGSAGMFYKGEQIWLCHPSDSRYPDCYRQVTVYGTPFLTFAKEVFQRAGYDVDHLSGAFALLTSATRRANTEFVSFDFVVKRQAMWAAGDRRRRRAHRRRQLAKLRDRNRGFTPGWRGHRVIAFIKDEWTGV